MRSVAFAALLVATGGAVQPSGLQLRNPEIEGLVRTARSLPPEFATDVLVRLAGSPRVTDSTWKRELIEEAWERETALLWFVHVSRLLDLAVGPDRPIMLEALESSEDPTMAIYARLERTGLSRRLTE